MAERCQNFLEVPSLEQVQSGTFLSIFLHFELRSSNLLNLDKMYQNVGHFLIEIPVIGFNWQYEIQFQKIGKGKQMDGDGEGGIECTDGRRNVWHC